MASNSMTSRVVPFLLVVVVMLFAANVSADVVSLTDTTFTDKVKEQDTVWFIKFFAPWCGHCKKLAPTWEELGKSLEGEDGVEVGLVDCTLQKKTCSSVDIRSYPTLKIFYNGEDIKKYSGPRDLESLKKFAIDSAAELSKAAEDDDNVATE
ncbi:unnamed protein product [Calypogeia fissa]